MQQRHQNRTVYFKEQALTCNRYYIPYLKPFINISPDLHILEIGCGEGGNLLPFAKIGCHVTGLDLNTGRIKEAISFFQQEGVKGEFLNIDIFDYKPSPKNSFNLIILHDVIEHIADKKIITIYYETIPYFERYYFYSFSIMANALWRTSTNMSQFINITFTFYTFITAMFI